MAVSILYHALQPEVAFIADSHSAAACQAFDGHPLRILMEKRTRLLREDAKCEETMCGADDIPAGLGGEHLTRWILVHVRMSDPEFQHERAELSAVLDPLRAAKEAALAAGQSAVSGLLDLLRQMPSEWLHALTAPAISGSFCCCRADLPDLLRPQECPRRWLDHAYEMRGSDPIPAFSSDWLQAWLGTLTPGHFCMRWELDGNSQARPSKSEIQALY